MQEASKKEIARTWNGGRKAGEFDTDGKICTLLGLPGATQFILTCGFSFAAVLTKPMTAALLAQ